MFFKSKNLNGLVHSHFVTALLLLASLMLVSCQTETATRLVPQTTYVLMPIYNKDTYAFQIREERAPSQQVLALPLKKPAAYKPRKIEVVEDPLILVGHQPQMIAELFGQPTRARKDNFSQIWQYYSKDCAMDVFFYNEAEFSETFVVEHIEVRSVNERSKEHCSGYFFSNKAVGLEKLDKIQYSIADKQ